MARLPDPQNIQGHRVSYSSEKKGTAIRIEIKEGKGQMNKKLKRALELCLGSCGGCKYHVVFENYCKKKKESVAFTDPACDDYEMWEMEKRDGRK